MSEASAEQIFRAQEAWRSNRSQMLKSLKVHKVDVEQVISSLRLIVILIKIIVFVILVGPGLVFMVAGLLASEGEAQVLGILALGVGFLLAIFVIKILTAFLLWLSAMVALTYDILWTTRTQLSVSVNEMHP